MLDAAQPGLVIVKIAGYFPDACTSLGQTGLQREGPVFRVQLTTQRPPDLLCAEVMTPFETTVTLDVVGLPAGDYTIDVNGTLATFELPPEN